MLGLDWKPLDLPHPSHPLYPTLDIYNKFDPIFLFRNHRHLFWAAAQRADDL